MIKKFWLIWCRTVDHRIGKTNEDNTYRQVYYGTSTSDGLTPAEVAGLSGKEIVSLNHESFDRGLFAEGALTAARWIVGKKPGLYSMRNVLNFI